MQTRRLDADFNYVLRFGLVYFLASFNPTLLKICHYVEQQLLSQKAQHGDGFPVVVALANFSKVLYFRRWKSWMLHSMCIDALCHEVFICHISIVFDLIHAWFNDFLEVGNKNLMLISL